MSGRLPDPRLERTSSESARPISPLVCAAVKIRGNARRALADVDQRPVLRREEPRTERVVGHGEDHRDRLDGVPSEERDRVAGKLELLPQAIVEVTRGDHGDARERRRLRSLEQVTSRGVERGRRLDPRPLRELEHERDLALEAKRHP